MTDLGGVDFNFSFAPGILDEQILGFELAGDIMSQYLHDTYKGDDLDINIHVVMGDDILPEDVAGGAFPAIETGIKYKKIYRALKKDRTTEIDDIAFDSLLGKNKFDVLVGDDVVENNRKMQVTRANLKALGMIKEKDFDQLDGLIVMNSLENVDSVSWNYNYFEEPQEGELDFLSVAMHEIGHSIGFISGIDTSNWNEESDNFSGNRINHMTPMDLFRYSEESFEQNINDLTFGRAAYFSIDGTMDNAIAMSTGTDYQGSHWANSDSATGIGIMNPTIKVGEKWEISEADLKAFDVIGWDVDYDADFELKDLVEDVVEYLYDIDLEDLFGDDDDFDDNNYTIDLDVLFADNQLTINDSHIADRFDEIEDILTSEVYNWGWTGYSWGWTGYS
ncbi:MAG: NF038122 family metalloprotease [Xenococcus sp. (in: cyanobacteria)]